MRTYSTMIINSTISINLKMTPILGIHLLLELQYCGLPRGMICTSDIFSNWYYIIIDFSSAFAEVFLPKESTHISTASILLNLVLPIYHHELYLCFLKNYLTYILTISWPLPLDYFTTHITSRLQIHRNHVKTWNKLFDGGQQVVSLPIPPVPPMLMCLFSFAILQVSTWNRVYLFHNY